jgi:hypothetical protein
VSSFIAADDLNDQHRRACSRDHCQPEPTLMFSEHGDHLVGSDAGLERGRGNLYWNGYRR